MGTDAAAPGFVQHDRVRIVEVSGSDARGWLNDLVTGPVGSLAPGEATRSLLLTPTGRIRADFTVADPGGGAPLTLVWDAGQPDAVDELLSRYVLSSDVELSDATQRLALFSVPGSAQVAELPDAARAFRPSPLGPGVGLLVERSVASDVARGLRATMPVATADAVERWRVAAAVPLFGTDFDAGALPAEAGLESAIDFTKGCFLGQESVAKVRNLGHPQTVIVALHAPSGVTRGDGVYANGTAVGTVTSAASVPDDGTVLLARIHWDARNEDLSTGAGVAVSLREVNATQT